MSGPLKRHPALQSFSRSHHEGLLLCFKIREGVKRAVDTQRIKRYCDWFWENHLLPHFLEEEETVFPLLGHTHPEVKTALEQHKKLKELFTGAVPDHETLLVMERELENHIRFEERVLFNTIQQAADPERVLEIRSENSQTASCEVWHDAFWMEKPG